MRKDGIVEYFAAERTLWMLSVVGGEEVGDLNFHVDGEWFQIVVVEEDFPLRASRKYDVENHVLISREVTILQLKI
jgi:hypothetical protein